MDMLSTLATILLVDDDEHSREGIAHALEAEGHTLVRASSYREACERFLEHDFDLIIADMGLPDASGIELLCYLKEAGYENPIVLIDDAPSERSVQKAIRHGAFDYLAKPVDRAELMSSLRRALESVEQRRSELAQRVECYVAYKKMEKEFQQLREEIERLKVKTQLSEVCIESLYENHPYGIAVATPDGKLVCVNHTLKRMLAIEEHETIQGDVFELLSIPSKEHTIRKLEANKELTVRTERGIVELYQIAGEDGDKLIMAVMGCGR